ncbi:MAG: hypothetical protein R3B72_31145 [Polyangiaceae bacterium]
MLELEGYAALRATIERSGDREAALTAAGLTVPQWIAVQRHWLRALAQEAGRGRRTLLRRFEAAYAPGSGNDGAGRYAAAPSGPRPSALPSPPSMTTPPVPPPPSAAPAMASSSLPPPMATPSAPSPASAPPRLEPDFSEVEATPFSGRLEVAPPSAAAEIAAEAQSMLGGTAQGSLSMNDPSLADFAAVVRQLRSKASAETTAPMRLPEREDPGLPFAAGISAAPPPPAASDVAKEAAELVGETAAVSALSDEDLAGALPFAPRTRLTLEQYASLVAELHGQPSSTRGPVLRRYGLDETSFQAVEAEWRERFAADPGSYGTFRARYDEYSAWLRKR